MCAREKGGSEIDMYYCQKVACCRDITWPLLRASLELCKKIMQHRIIFKLQIPVRKRMNENEKNTPFLTTFFANFKNVVTSADGHEKWAKMSEKKIPENFRESRFLLFFWCFLVFLGTFKIFQIFFRIFRFFSFFLEKKWKFRNRFFFQNRKKMFSYFVPIAFLRRAPAPKSCF